MNIIQAISSSITTNSIVGPKSYISNPVKNGANDHPNTYREVFLGVTLNFK
jgi:hypothetical protein